MDNILKLSDIENRILVIRDQRVLIDKDVAELYGVETKDINRAVKNNLSKFPEGYTFSLTSEENEALRLKIFTLDKPAGRGQHSKYVPTAFTEKGLYMLATILKSPHATETTIAIVETFAKIREFGKLISELPNTSEEADRKELMKHSGDLFLDILDDNTLDVTGDEVSFELDLAIMKVKRTVKREKRK